MNIGWKKLDMQRGWLTCKLEHWNVIFFATCDSAKKVHALVCNCVRALRFRTNIIVLLAAFFTWGFGLYMWRVVFARYDVSIM